MGITGDFEGLRELQRDLSRVSDWAKRELAETIGRQALDLIHYSFESSTDPEGNPWQPVLRGGKPLSDTGGFQASFSVLVAGAGFSIESRFPWAEVHNEGATIRARGSGSFGPGGTYSSRSGRLHFRIGNQWVSKYQVTIPARPFLPDVNNYDSDNHRWTRVFEAVVDKQIARFLGMAAEEVDVYQELSDMGVRSFGG